jgi:NAD(P)H-flavin reductase
MESDIFRVRSFDLAPDPMVPTPARISRVTRETHDTVTLEIVRREGTAPLPFSPGQFNMLYAFGIGEVPISISGDPNRTDRHVHTLRVVGAATRALAGSKRDDVIGMRGPFGSHWPLEAAVAHDVVIVAGGIGLAPLRPAIYEICARRPRYGKVSVLYGARTPSDVLYGKEFDDWIHRHDIQFKATVDRGDPDWAGPVGVVTTQVQKAHFDPRQTIAMVCGPEIMSRFAVLELRKAGVPKRSIFVSMERNMKCAVGFCGHCQFGPDFICKDGPVLPYSRIRNLFNRAEV